MVDSTRCQSVSTVTATTTERYNRERPACQ